MPDNITPRLPIAEDLAAKGCVADYGFFQVFDTKQRTCSYFCDSPRPFAVTRTIPFPGSTSVNAREVVARHPTQAEAETDARDRAIRLIEGVRRGSKQLHALLARLLGN